MHPKDWRAFFYPRSIAIIGASTKPFKFGSLFLKALLDFRYEGDIYPVNPRGVEIQGLKSWLLEDISEPVDLIYITVPAEQVPEELQKCAQKNFKHVIILSAGFKEAGLKGKEIENKCQEIIREYGIRVIGPNCFGIYHPRGRITLLPGGDFPKESGQVAMLSQSGGNSVNFVKMGQSEGLRFSKVISYGNALDLDLPDFLEYLNQDSETKIIAAYVEGVRDIAKLRAVLKDLNKPLIFWKSGLTEDGARAAASHTGFLSGHAEIWQGFFNQFKKKLIPVTNFEELLDTTKMLLYLPPLQQTEEYWRKIGIIGGGGGIGIELSDTANLYGLKIPKLTEPTREQLKNFLPLEGTSINNPLDIGTPMYMGDHKKVLTTFMSDPNISILIYDFIIDFVLDLKMMFRTLQNYKTENNIPIIVILRKLLTTKDSLGLEKKYRKFRDLFHQINIPVFPSFYRGIRALANCIRYYQNVAHSLFVIE
ncbi:MAG: CoA-binding protein [Candidatus Helarchaeota archaeon]